jgi:hypothetical protein
MKEACKWVEEMKSPYFYLHALNIFSNRNKKSVSLASFLHFCPHQVWVDFKSFPFLPTWSPSPLPPPHWNVYAKLATSTTNFLCRNTKWQRRKSCIVREAFRAANILRKKLWNFANFLSIRLAATDNTCAILDFLGNFGCPSWLYTIGEGTVEANANASRLKITKIIRIWEWEY